MKIYHIADFLVVYLLILQGNGEKYSEEKHARNKRNTRDCHRKNKEIPGHTACLPRSSQVIDSDIEEIKNIIYNLYTPPDVVGISDEDKRLIVDLHNNARSTVDPPAVAMLKMTWDDEVALLAQAWAENCVQAHDEWYNRFVPGRFTVGQNLAMGWGFPKMTWRGAFDGWYNEVKQYTYGGPNSLPTVGHYTQMVWENSTKLGCGYAQCDAMYYFVCNYAPAGNLNFHSRNPYQSGQSCDKCPQTCNNKLCDCGSRVCLNGGEVDVNTCACSCLNFKHYIGEYCSLDCDLLSEGPPCGTFYRKDECTRFSNYPFMCPGLCDVCPYGGIAYSTVTESPTGKPIGRSTNLQSSALIITVFILTVLISSVFV